LNRSGNDTIDRYPLPCEGKLTKLLCISRELFEKLKAALNEFRLRSKPVSSKPKTPFRKKLPKKELLISSKNDDLKPDSDKYIGSYEPSNILNTRNSAFWRLRNLNAWFKEQESYEDSRYLKSYSIKI
jgi:hypothetical protein